MEKPEIVEKVVKLRNAGKYPNDIVPILKKQGIDIDARRVSQIIHQYRDKIADFRGRKEVSNTIINNLTEQSYEKWLKNIKKKAERYWIKQEIKPEKDSFAWILVPQYGEEITQALISAKSKNLFQFLLGGEIQ